MKHSFFAGLVAAALFVLASPMLAMADRPAVPADGLEFKGAKKSVPFPHSKHTVGMDCKTCHHEVNGKESYAKCATAGCHDDLQTKQGTKSLFAVAHSKKELAHQTCMSCHAKTVDAITDEEAKKAKKKELTGCKGSKCHS